MPEGEGGEARVPSVLDLDAVVKLGDRSVTVAELIEDRKKLAMIEEDYGVLASFREATKTLLTGKDPKAQSQAVRAILTDLGYPGEVIEDYSGRILASHQGNPGGEGDEDPEEEEDLEDDVHRNTKSRGGKGSDPRIQQLEEELAQVKAAALDAAQRSRKEQATRMTTQLQKEIERTLDSDPQARKLFTYWKGRSADQDGPSGSGDYEKARQLLVQDAIQRSLDGLRERRTLSGQEPNEQWLQEVAPRAVQDVLGKYAVVVGNPDKLGRAPETNGPFEGLKDQKPVAPPAFRKGMTTGDLEAQDHAWTVDLLSRAAASIDTKGESKV